MYIRSPQVEATITLKVVPLYFIPALVPTVPALEDYEKEFAANKVVPFSTAIQLPRLSRTIAECGWPVHWSIRMVRKTSPPLNRIR